METTVETPLRSGPAAPWPATDRTSRDHRFFLFAAAIALAVVGVGFGRGFLPGAPPHARPRTPLILVHASVFASWIVLFGTQTLLVASGRTRIHRRVGLVGVALAATMLVLGFAVAVQAARTGYAPVPGVDPLRFLIVPIGDLVVFAPLVCAAIYWRRTPDVHKRFMWLATVNMLFPAVTRLPGVQGRFPAILASFVVLLACAPFYERVVVRRMHRVSLWGGLAVAASIPIRDAIGITSAWRTFAVWLTKM